MVIQFKHGKATLRPHSPEVEVSPSATVMLMRDGTEIVALLGPNLQTGICGFGDTVIDALRDLVDEMECEKFRLEGVDF